MALSNVFGFAFLSHWVVAVMGGAVASSIFHEILVFRLKRYYPDVWDSLRSGFFPKKMLGQVSQTKLMRWLWSKQYLLLEDVGIARVAAAYRVAIVGMASGAGLLLLIFGVSALSSNMRWSGP